MKAIGIRVKAKDIVYCVVEERSEGGEIHCYIHANEKLIVPQALEMPDRLSYVRTSFESIIKEYGVENAGIRIAEMSSAVNSSIIERTYLEGVIQELLSNCSVDNYFSGRKNTIARLLEFDQRTISSYIDGESALYDFENWDDFSKYEREAIVAGFASLQLGSVI